MQLALINPQRQILKKTENQLKTRLIQRTSKIIELAQKIAQHAHYGQERKNGDTYITHVEHVVKQLEGDTEAQIIAWLHDVLEDSDYTADRLIKEGITEALVEDVKLLTKKREHTYNQYIDVIKTSTRAIKVKKADIIANLSDNPSNKQIIKLSKALIRLCSK